MNPVPLLDRKRRGEALSPDEIAALIAAFTVGGVEDYQMSAFAMAVCCRSMNPLETTAITRAMLESGSQFNWASGPPVVDKHSTGGQGDKSSLILAPLLASLGFRVPMISGRGLGPTGGTLDKLAAIPGFRTELSLDEIEKLVDGIGVAMAGQTKELCPADRKLYALRDATATVASIPLITSSILCKKLAESLDALVLDVKFGAGAFLPELEDARALAMSLVSTAKEFGLKSCALLTSMEQPTGRMVGNALEVKEAIEALQGNGAADLMELVASLAVELLLATKKAADSSSARLMVEEAIESGEAFEKFREMLVAQGGDPDAELHVASREDLLADRSGFIAAIDGSKKGYALIALGGGRIKKTDAVDPSVGFELLSRLGEEVRAGEPLVAVHANARGKAEAMALLKEAIVIADAPGEISPLILERIA